MKQFPLTFNERMGLKIKKEKHTLQQEADKFFEFTNKNQFLINEKKCEVITFNFSKKYAFPPNIKVGNSDILTESTHARVLGLIIEENLKWNKNTEFYSGKLRQSCGFCGD